MLCYITTNDCAPVCVFITKLMGGRHQNGCPNSLILCSSKRRQSGGVVSWTLADALRAVIWDMGAALGATHLHSDHAVPKPERSQQLQHYSRRKTHIFTRRAAKWYTVKPFCSGSQHRKWGGLKIKLVCCWILDHLADLGVQGAKLISVSKYLGQSVNSKWKLSGWSPK